LAVWAVDPPRPIRDVLQTYTTFLTRSSDIEGRERLPGEAAPANVHRLRPGFTPSGRRLSDRELVLMEGREAARQAMARRGEGAGA
jgi:hypothetical protein